jgi:catechol 2,3-dioxygenase-like lactoylglutathione lyase family enzyme
MKIDHINIAAPLALLQECRDFYCAVLELEEGPRPDFGVPGYWLYGDGHPIVHLIEKNQQCDPEQPRYLDHVAFAVQNLPAYIARLEQHGVKYSVREIPEYKISQVFCNDPCGNGVEANIANG